MRTESHLSLVAKVTAGDDLAMSINAGITSHLLKIGQSITSNGI